MAAHVVCASSCFVGKEGILKFRCAALCARHTRAVCARAALFLPFFKIRAAISHQQGISRLSQQEQERERDSELLNG